jgi:hypothetical protein
MARQKKEVWAKQGRVLKAESRWHLQGIKLLPKSPLDSTPLERGTGRGRGYLEESDPKQEFFSEKRAERKRGEREREKDTGLELGLWLGVKG